MASGVLDFTFQLIDKASGKALGISKSLDKMNDTLMNVRSTAAKVKDPAEQATKGAGKGAKEAAGGFGNLRGALMQTWVATKAVELGAQAMSAAFDQIVLGAKLEDQFKGIVKKATGSAAQAEISWRAALQTASQTGVSLENTIARTADLMASGIGVVEANNLVRAFEDLTTIDPGAKIEPFLEMLSQADATGEMSAKKMAKAIGKAGMDVLPVYEQIAASLGIVGGTAEDRMKMVADAMDKGKVATEQVVKAFNAATQAKTGLELGGAAAEKMKTTFGGVLQLIQTRFGLLMTALAGSKGFEPIQKALGFVADILDPTSNSMKVLGNIASKVFAGLSAAFDGAKASAGPLLGIAGGIFDKFSAGESVTSMLKGVIKIIGLVARVIGILIGVVAIAASVILPIFWAIYGTIASTLGTAAGIVSKFVDSVAVSASGIGASVQGIINWFTSLPSRIGAGIMAALSFVGQLAAGFLQIGVDIVAGLVNGITSSGSAILDALTGAVGGAVQGVKSMLGIASPSRVFAEIGGHTAAGMAMGVDDGSGDVSTAMTDMVAPPEVDLAAAGRPANGNGGGVVQNIVFHVQGGGDPVAIARTIEQMLVGAGERLALELGAA